MLNGIGITEDVNSALVATSSTSTESVPKYLIFVDLSTNLLVVLHAMMDMT